MEQRRLGTHGPLVSAVGLGCNNFGRIGSKTEGIDGTAAVLAAAIDAGVTLLVTADMYGGNGTSERLMGEVLEHRRDEVVLATKFGHAEVEMPDLPTVPKGSRDYVLAALDASMTRLRTEVIDLYQLHTPDPVTPIGDTIAVLEERLAALPINAEFKQFVRGKSAIEEIEALVEELNVTVLVIGLRRRTAVGKLLLGSMAQEILMTVNCPVLAVKAGS